MAKRKKDEDRLWTDEEWQAAVERSIALIKEAQEKAQTMTYDEFAKWWDEHGAVKGGGAYEALLEMREAMRGWEARPNASDATSANKIVPVGQFCWSAYQARRGRQKRDRESEGATLKAQ